MVPEFESRIRLCADGSETGACFGFCFPISLPCSHSVCVCVSLSLSKVSNHKKKFFFKCMATEYFGKLL